MTKQKRSRSSKATETKSRASKPTETNKSAAIRNVLTKDPEGKPQAIARALADQGVQVSAAFVSQVKLKMKQRGTQGTKRGLSDPTSQFAGNDLIEAKRLIDKLGVEKARAAVELLAKLS